MDLLLFFSMPRTVPLLPNEKEGEEADEEDSATPQSVRSKVPTTSSDSKRTNADRRGTRHGQLTAARGHRIAKKMLNVLMKMC